MMGIRMLFAIGRISVVILLFAAYCFSSISVNSAAAEEKADPTSFKDPYNGGTRLPEGGGEPGKAYTTYVNEVNGAADNKDYSRLCRLMPEAPQEKCLNEKDAREFLIGLYCKMPDAPADRCSTEKDALDFILQLFTFGVPKTHKVLGGFLKDDEATLNVAFTWANMPESLGRVVMKRQNGRWSIFSIGGSGSMDVDVQASGTATFGSEVEGDHFGPISLAADRDQYVGSGCPIDITYTASVSFRSPLPKDFSFTYYWERSDGSKTGEGSVAPGEGEKPMLLREVWHLGEAGRQYEASMRLRIESGNLQMAIDSPAVKVICK